MGTKKIKTENMYLAHLGHSTATKNKLEEEFFQYLKSIDRTNIENESVNEFKKLILDQYQSLCEKHHRCKPITKKIEKHYGGKGDFILYGSNTVFILLKSKN